MDFEFYHYLIQQYQDGLMTRMDVATRLTIMEPDIPRDEITRLLPTEILHYVRDVALRCCDKHILESSTVGMSFCGDPNADWEAVQMQLKARYHAGVRAWQTFFGMSQEGDS